MSLSSNKPYVGVAYYPEAWPSDYISQDIEAMQRVGINLARLGEFCWSRLEPEEKSFDFSWLLNCCESLASAGIDFVLCTPTATPPAWMSESYPDILRVNALGLQVGHGGRRHYCPNSRVYRTHTERIVRRIAKEFGSHPNLVAWQVDNEFFEDCYCGICRNAFHTWLEQRFRSIDQLNKSWNTMLWSQEYQRFSQIPLPNPHAVGASHHPSLIRAYRHFMSDSYISYCQFQSAIIRSHSDRPITTNSHSPAAHLIDGSALFNGLDFVSTDSYAGPTDLKRYAFECDGMRPLKKRPFWLMETASTHSAGVAASSESSFAFYPGSLRAKMWLAYALGAGAVCFWHWRAHWAGQEMEHGSLISIGGVEAVNTHEVRQTSKELAEHGEWLSRTIVQPSTFAMHYSMSAHWIFNSGSIASGYSYDSRLAELHGAIISSGRSVDLIPTDAPLVSYRMVMSAHLPSISPETLARIQEFVEHGGTWICGPFSGSRTEEGTAHRDGGYGREIEEYLGVRVMHRLPCSHTMNVVGNGWSSACRIWCDAYDNGANGVLASYSGGPLDGMAAIVESRIGEGRVVILGTQPSDECLIQLLDRYGVQTRNDRSSGVVLAHRLTDLGEDAGYIAVNTSASDGYFRSSPGQRKSLKPYEVIIQSHLTSGNG